MSEPVQGDEGQALVDNRRRNWFWDYNDVFDSSLSEHAMLVRLYLARCANQEREAWPSLNTIARRCRISKPTAIKALRELEDQGWIRRTVRKRANDEYDSTVYYLEDPPEAPGGGKGALPPVKNEGGSKPGLPPGKAALPGGKNENAQTGVAVSASGGNNTQGTIKSDIPDYTHTSYGCNQGGSRPAASANQEKVSGIEQWDEPGKMVPFGPVAGQEGGELNPDLSGAVNNHLLISELTDAYRKAVPGDKHRSGDHAFVGRLYNDYGYDRVLLAVNDLAYKVEAGFVPDSPLVYLKGMVARSERRQQHEEYIERGPADAGGHAPVPGGGKLSPYPHLRIINGQQFYY